MASASSSRGCAASKSPAFTKCAPRAARDAASSTPSPPPPPLLAAIEATVESEEDGKEERARCRLLLAGEGLRGAAKEEGVGLCREDAPARMMPPPPVPSLGVEGVMGGEEDEDVILRWMATASSSRERGEGSDGAMAGVAAAAAPPTSIVWLGRFNTEKAL